MADVFDLWYGAPGSAKSRSLIALIQKVHKETGKIARVYIGDGSMTMYRNSGLIKSGVIVPMEFSTRQHPFSTCQQITEGYWPTDPNDPDSKMVRLTPDQVMKTGLWIFEGASVMGTYMMGTMKGGLAQRAAEGEVIGQEANIAFQDGPAGLKFGGNPGAHYNVGQRHLLSDILRSKSLPGIVIWTAHERMDDGERGGAFSKGQAGEKVKLGEKCIGPELVGKALTASISRDFGNTLHFTTATKKVQDGTDPATGKGRYVEKAEYRVYTREHYDPDGIVGLPYLAVNRAMFPEKVKDYYVSPISNPGEGVIKFYDDISAAGAN